MVSLEHHCIGNKIIVYLHPPIYDHPKSKVVGNFRYFNQRLFGNRGVTFNSVYIGRTVYKKGRARGVGVSKAAVAELGGGGGGDVLFGRRVVPGGRYIAKAHIRGIDYLSRRMQWRETRVYAFV